MSTWNYRLLAASQQKPYIFISFLSFKKSEIYPSAFVKCTFERK